jgi:endogenous inhibitor of DNA gyrase (YacG/DUF329 family)
MSNQPVQLTIFNCYQCGKPMSAGRSDKRFCGSACRKRHERWLDGHKQDVATATACIDNLAKAARYDEVASQSVLRLKRLKQRIDEHLQVLAMEGRK